MFFPARGSIILMFMCLFLIFSGLFLVPSIAFAVKINPLFRYDISCCCQTLIGRLPLPSVDEVMEGDGLNGLESIEHLNMLKIDLSLYFVKLRKATDICNVKLLLERIINLIDLMAATLSCKGYRAIFSKESDYILCRDSLQRVRFYGQAISYVIHRHEMEDIYHGNNAVLTHGKLNVCSIFQINHL